MISTGDPLQDGPAAQAMGKFGEPCGTRTHDPLIKSQVLYRLS